MNAATVHKNIFEISRRFARERRERQQRHQLAPEDFSDLRDAGLHLTGVPVDQGGLWESVAQSTRPICNILRTLAHGDSSIALVCSMHPTVLSFWLANTEVPSPHTKAWEAQRRRLFQTAHEGNWWGTITSEPGGGGDLAKTKAIARLSPDKATYLISGQKHFGSGMGIVSYMLTTAVPAGEQGSDWFFVDMRNVPWDGSTGLKLIVEWDGHGMYSTQSHAASFSDFPAERIAWPGNQSKTISTSGGFILCAFASVIVGIIETAIASARENLLPKKDTLRSYEQVEWSRVEIEGWLLQQAYEGMLQATENESVLTLQAFKGKLAIAELAESIMQRICRIIGGGTFSRRSPYGFWFEDVRALGFLRPPWALGFERLYQECWNTK